MLSIAPAAPQTREAPLPGVKLAERQEVGEGRWGVRDQKEYMNCVKERGEWEDTALDSGKPLPPLKHLPEQVPESSERCVYRD